MLLLLWPLLPLSRMPDKHRFMLVHAKGAVPEAVSDGAEPAVDVVSVTPDAAPTWGIWIFYAVFVVLLAFEGAVVGAVVAAARALHHPSAGPWAAWVLFVVGVELCRT